VRIDEARIGAAIRPVERNIVRAGSILVVVFGEYSIEEGRSVWDGMM
jgi:hypothetical protein